MCEGKSSPAAGYVASKPSVSRPPVQDYLRTYRGLVMGGVRRSSALLCHRSGAVCHRRRMAYRAVWRW